MSDLHDSSRGLSAIINFLKKEKNIGGVVFAGDLVNMGEPVEFAEKFITEISHFNIPLLWVPGNNDFGQSYEVLQNHTKSLEGRIVKLGSREFTGVGGSPASWESEYGGERPLKKEDISGTIFVSHYPLGPIKLEKFDRKITNYLSTLLEASKLQITNKFQNPNYKHQNCHCEELATKQSNNGTIKQYNNLQLADAPIAHICGHIHSTQGIGYIGETKVVKLASSALGNIAIMNLENLNVKFIRVL